MLVASAEVAAERHSEVAGADAVGHRVGAVHAGAAYDSVVLNVFFFARRGTFFITDIMVPSWRVGEQVAVVNRTKGRGDRLAVAIGE
jgi:hypothetical protein